MKESGEELKGELGSPAELTGDGDQVWSVASSQRVSHAPSRERDRVREEEKRENKTEASE